MNVFPLQNFNLTSIHFTAKVLDS